MTIDVDDAVARIAAAGPSARVAYAGPRVLRGRETLRARLTPGAEPVVAVTFLLDGAPLGTDTAPYALDADASVFPSGRHRLRVEAVDRLGRRTSGRPLRVTAEPDRSDDILTASPSGGLAPALAALARGDVTVLLAPGRYAVPHVELGSGARLVGSGARTVIAASRPGWSLVTVSGRGVRIADLAIPGASGSRQTRQQEAPRRSVRRRGSGRRWMRPPSRAGRSSRFSRDLLRRRLHDAQYLATAVFACSERSKRPASECCNARRAAASACELECSPCLEAAAPVRAIGSFVGRR